MIWSVEEKTAWREAKKESKMPMKAFACSFLYF